MIWDVPNGFRHVDFMDWPGAFIVLEFAILSAGHNTNLNKPTRAYSVYHGMHTMYYVVRTMMSMLRPPPKPAPSEVVGHCQKGIGRPGESNVRTVILSIRYLPRCKRWQRDTGRYHGVSMGDGDKGRGTGTGTGTGSSGTCQLVQMKMKHKLGYLGCHQIRHSSTHPPHSTILLRYLTHLGRRRYFSIYSVLQEQHCVATPIIISIIIISLTTSSHSLRIVGHIPHKDTHNRRK